MRVEIPNQITVTIGGLISRGVKAAEVTDEGKLVFTLTDGSTIDLGPVVGPEGEKGDTGAAGPQGQAGPQGETEPNEITTGTDTEIAGLMKGVDGKVAQAVAGTDYMAPVAVAAADNGKFLRVVNGAWAAAEVADANGEGF